MTDGPEQTDEKASNAAVERNVDVGVDLGCNNSLMVNRIEPNDDCGSCGASRSDEAQRTLTGSESNELQHRDIHSRVSIPAETNVTQDNFITTRPLSSCRRSKGSGWD